jgi:hypothetical protein
MGAGLRGVDRYRADGGRGAAVHDRLDAEVEVLLRAGDGRAEVGVGSADLEDGGVVAVDSVELTYALSAMQQTWTGGGLEMTFLYLLFAGSRRSFVRN